MLLLIIDDSEAMRKKELYIHKLPVDGVVHVNTIEEAEKKIEDNKRFGCLVINNILLENKNYCLSELKKLSGSYDGGIILKVSDELLGLNLLKQKIITEYYLEDSDKEKEFKNLEKAFRLAMIKNRLEKSFIEAKCEVNKCGNILVK